ncbi:hypothetical protein RMN57_30270 [Kitasatospora sp. CM 4170]|uniref:Type II toxin-antitoxin system VapC family toxin n=1 Tax=Kitasatospora aburaviensis TaxID=67265 RepID=A0ABW1EPG4_9ACTN|nr:hypothetical protein [Kitasatospora sp. CM 4170]WNM48675.1 hypothetical protein RMN57_30270 [Kitasatospora sp. CM 4170]
MTSTSVYVLDSEGLSQTALGNRAMGAQLQYAQRHGIPVVTTTMTLVEAHHARVNQAAWKWILSRIVVVPITQDVSDQAIHLLAEAGLHGHKYAIDAVLAAVALRQPGDVTVFTSDVDDMERLCGNRLVVQPI